jgi:monofunctional biosynthetic peptidoglycan transglycosylase
LWSLLIAVLLPAVLLVIFRFVPVPLTPLMVIRLIEGEALHKDWVPLAQIAPSLRQAVVAAEDNLFCEHGGFDWTALGEVLDELRAGGQPRGASTITMQTAKNLFLWPERSLLRKGLEAWLTPQVELIWDKRRILEVYLNIVEMGPGIYGAEAAAQRHFGRSAADLGRLDSSLLAAVLPNPRAWSAAAPTDYILDRARTIRTRIDQLGPMLACTDAAL